MTKKFAYLALLSLSTLSFPIVLHSTAHVWSYCSLQQRILGAIDLHSSAHISLCLAAAHILRCFSSFIGACLALSLFIHERILALFSITNLAFLRRRMIGATISIQQRSLSLMLSLSQAVGAPLFGVHVPVSSASF